jgi:ABC-type branched-subunit amino acid transport system substrate-binding protein
MREIVANDRIHGMIGLAMTEDAAIIRHEIDTSTKIPVLSFEATTNFDGHYCFQTPCGTFLEEAPVIAAFIKARGYERFGLMHDTSFQGEEYGEALRASANRVELGVVSSHGINSLAPEEQITEHLLAARHSGIQAFSYVGVGMQFKQLATAMRRIGWEPPLKICGLKLVGAHPGFDGPSQYEGWYGLDQFHEGNEVMQRMAAAFERPFGRDGAHMWAAHGYVEGRLMALALGNANPPTPAGVREAMEQIRMLPSAVGGPGNMMSFGPFDHRAYKGDYFVIRRVIGGRNELVGVPSQFLAKL